jgi:hypothetical protein
VVISTNQAVGSISTSITIDLIKSYIKKN